MTAKEKAKELIDKMYYSGRYDDKEDYNPDMAWERAKQCALIAVNEIIDAIDWHEYETPNKELNYWLDIRKEIEKL